MLENLESPIHYGLCDPIPRDLLTIGSQQNKFPCSQYMPLYLRKGKSRREASFRADNLNALFDVASFELSALPYPPLFLVDRPLTPEMEPKISPGSCRAFPWKIIG